MSALAMILTAAMMVQGDGPERVSGEIAQPQRLDLRGGWLFKYWGGEVREEDFIRRFKVRDEGHGQLRMAVTVMGTEFIFVGIYRQERDQVLICIRKVEDGCPTEFQDADGQHLLILRRVKSHK